ncbi:MAG: electron transfer flavoprotein subunit alpha/FixB family protein [Armatimonadetes bacterium]|nr:electron transfer flavoprotein subunit alpha/FixB family protein [Armatimonadota bacterium]
MAGNIWVLAAQWRGQLQEVTYEVLALGRRLAADAGVQLEAVLLGHNARDLAPALEPADVILWADHPELAEPTPETYALALAQLVKARQPRALLIPLTNVAMDVGPLLAAHLDVPFVNFCKTVRVADGALEARCGLYGNKVEVTVAASGAPAILGVLPGTHLAERGGGQAPSIEEVPVELPEAPRVRFVRYIEPQAGDVDITQHEVLVAVGRGIQRQDNVALAEVLAEALGGAVCASRPVIDQGWLPLSRQVGRSGMQVKPKLYLALGISGAPEHVEGMKDSGLIVAVNTDPAAPIFGVAHVGATADLLEVVPALIDRVKAAKGGKAA